METKVNDPATKQEWLNSLRAQHQRITWLPYSLWAAILAVLLGIALAGATRFAHAEPRFQVANKDITITLYDDPCELKDQISNLPFKAEWKEGAKTYRGCWGPRPDVEAVLFYFDDKTMGAIPFGAIHKVVGA
jgi:hypothetical protein